ncbi:binding protein [[Candida] boidinii]|nr:binding protein [[Candida] boidinii]OWB72906.1 binding protein [[Candida] boidinii]OWB78429.1 binding protein [[Candida] boidinii]
MTTYSSQTVPQLKDLLKARGLSTTGVKAELISRLEESDKIAAELDIEDGANTSVAAPVTEVAPAPVEEAAPISEAAPVTESIAPVSEAPKAEVTEVSEPTEPETAPVVEEKKELTPEELKAAAIDLLTKKIARSRKFGNEEEAASFEGNLKRIEKFGIALDSPIARELGVAPKERRRSFNGSKNGNRHHNNNKHGNRNGNKYGGIKKNRSNSRGGNNGRPNFKNGNRNQRRD